MSYKREMETDDETISFSESFTLANRAVSTPHQTYKGYRSFMPRYAMVETSRITSARFEIHEPKLLELFRALSMTPMTIYGYERPSRPRATRMPMSPQHIEVLPVLLKTCVPEGTFLASV